MLITDAAANYLARHRVELVTIDGKLALAVPETRFARMWRRLRAAISGRRRLDPEAIIG
jgi:hypothetical protein